MMGGERWCRRTNKGISDRAREGEVRWGANKGKGRCSVEREREGGGKGYNDVIARPLRASTECWPVTGPMNAVKRDEMHTMHRETS